MADRGTAVIVVNWNGLDETRACLRSLEAAKSEWTSCVVVDNGSVDRSSEHVRREFPWARVIEARTNLGYAGGNNLGIREALATGASNLFLLNNDAVVEAGAIERLRDLVAGDRTIGIAGPLAVETIPAGDYFLFGGTLTRRPFRVRERWRREPPESAEPFEVDYASGRALFLTRATCEALGFFDERFFLTWEDTDWGQRIRRLGLRSVVLPSARIRHRGSASFDGIFSPLYAYYFFRNMALFARIHFEARERPRAYRDTAALARSVLVHRAGGRRLRVAGAIALGISHFVLRRFGPAPAALTEAALHGRAAKHRVVPLIGGQRR